MGKHGLVILPRLSADKLAAVAAAKQQQQQQQQRGPVHSLASHGQSGDTIRQASSSSSSSSVGAALADPSVLGEPWAPPLWAMQQLATHLRKALGMNLFNIDIIAPNHNSSGVSDRDVDLQGGQQQQQQQQGSVQQLLVVDINYFPGYDKISGAEELFAEFLAQCAGGCKT
jgi:hypothetical protein